MKRHAAARVLFIWVVVIAHVPILVNHRKETKSSRFLTPSELRQSGGLSVHFADGGGGGGAGGGGAAGAEPPPHAQHACSGVMPLLSA